MDFLDPNKKRKHTIRLYLGYILVACAIALASLILLFQSYGFDVDRHTGQVIQNGLVFVSAHPESAAIYINGKPNGAHTDARLPLPAGEYTVELKRDNYRDWKRSFYLEGGAVVHLDYPTLFPTKLTTKDVQLYGAAPSLLSTSPDRHWVLVEHPGSLTDFDVFDTANIQQPPKTIALPDTVLTKSDKPERLEVAEWASDNRHLLLVHYFGDSKEYIVMDREQPSASSNINTAFSISPTKITLRDKSPDKFFFYDEASHTLETADSKTKQTAQYLTHVLTYKTHGADTVLYSSDDSPVTGTHAIKLWDGGKTYVLRTITNDDVLLDTARFDNSWYMVVAVKPEGRVQIYKDPQDMLKQKPSDVLTTASVLKLDAPERSTFSDNARFIAAQSGNRIAVYDIQEKRRYYYELPLSPTNAPIATWMDGHRLLYTNGGKLSVFDFDGTNAQTLMPANDGLPVGFDADYVKVLAIGPSQTVQGKPALTSTSLKNSP